MLRRRRPRFAMTLCAVLAMLWAQLALARVVCPGMAPQGAAMAMTMAAGEPCHGMAYDPLPPALCHGHCAGVDTMQSVEAAMKLPSPSLPMVWQAWPLPLALLAGPALDATGPPWRQGDEVPHPPPAAVFLATHRLRV